ncbi:sodium- and chloride-dependent glycine transporter 2-like [Penaeus japonicus]|uniref:sodium- and chloride-dependent glycine transporter 2-like n=1 Tax=Penaeus japonicus TaxID=27405 RepID=UPI001C70F835|nr:sodium- and chloride-dependent glycine transporter 2-like [Penaeus japonicus]
MADVEMNHLWPPGEHNTSASASSPSPDKTSPDADHRDKEAESWASPLDHLATLLSFTMGLQHIMRFPFLYHANGGGAYLLVHLFLMAVFGIPLFLLESFIGQFTSSNCIRVHSLFPAFKGLGIASCIVIILVAPYLAVLFGYPLIYFVHTFISIEDWNLCSDVWETDGCVPSVSFVFPLFCVTGQNDSASYGLSWRLVLAVFLVWFLVFLALFKGLKVLGKVMWVTAGLPFLLLVILFFRGVTLPGAWGGGSYIFFMEARKLVEISTWKSALDNILFSYSFGLGTYTTRSVSYNPFRHNFARDVLVVSAASVTVEIIAGISLTCIWGFLAHQMQVPFSNVLASGFDATYYILPQAFSLMPYAKFWTCLYFLFVFVIGLPALIVYVQVLTDCILTSISPQRRRMRWALVLVTCTLGFLLSLIYCAPEGLERLFFVDMYAESLTTRMVCFLEVIIFAYVYGAGRIARDMEMICNKIASYYCYFTWISIAPLVLLIALTAYLILLGEELIGGMALACVAPLAFLVYVLCYVFRNDCCKIFQEEARPWGPKTARDREAWDRYCTERPLRNSLVHRALKRSF